MPPGPKSKELHTRCTKYFKGLSEQVKLFPVVFDYGKGCELVDVDGNRYIDFSSGIYVTTLGHCHPKVTEAVQKMAARIMNCHDFTTEIKTRLEQAMEQGAKRGSHLFLTVLDSSNFSQIKVLGANPGKRFVLQSMVRKLAAIQKCRIQ